MSVFVLHRATNSLGPSFNEASSLLATDTNVTVLDSCADDGERGAVVIVEAADTAAEALEKKLPDWTIAKMKVHKVPGPKP